MMVERYEYGKYSMEEWAMNQVISIAFMVDERFFRLA